MLLPFAYLQVRTSSFFRYTFSSHYLEFHISIFRRNIFTMHRAYNVDSTTYAYVRVATWAGCCGRTGERTGNIRLRASCDVQGIPRGYPVALATYAYMRVATALPEALATGLGWQHTLTCELRHGAGRQMERVQPWQHTLTCELRLHIVLYARICLQLATYAYVRVATYLIWQTTTREDFWQHTLTCELRPSLHLLMLFPNNPGNIRLRASCDS